MPTADLGDALLYYKQWGDGRPVLGVMGFALDQRFWAGQIPAVTETHRFITFDNRAIGRSTGEPPTSLAQMADDALRLLDYLSIDKAVIFGASMGGTIAQRIALDHAERVEGLILAVTWARPTEFMRRQNNLGRLLAEAGGLDALIEASLVRMFTPAFFEVGAETLDRLVGSLSADGAPRVPDKRVLAAQIDAFNKHDALAELSVIDCPTLVLGGKMDVMVPGFASEEIAAAIPGAELHMFDTGHACMVEEMDAFNARVSEFLRRLL